MGMPISIHLRGSRLDTAEDEQRVAAAFDELRRVDSLFSTYRPDSQISRLNRGDIRLADCDPMVREVARCATRAGGAPEGTSTRSCRHPGATPGTTRRGW